MSKIKMGFQRYEKKPFIEHYLQTIGMNQAEVAKRAGVSKNAVSVCLNGKGNSTKVLDCLREIGVPEEYLCDPRSIV